jgi:hypothetical protein
MYFKIEGNFDMSPCVMDKANFGEVKLDTFIELLYQSNVHIVNSFCDSEIEDWKEKAKKYDGLHPKMTLNEDFISYNISDKELKMEFNKFLGAISSNTCQLTIVDPYLFASGTNVNLFLSIVKDNVLSKSIKFIFDSSHNDLSVYNQIITSLKTDNFIIDKSPKKRLHDRWWFTRKAGFAVGASFSGLTRKDTTFKMLDDDELNSILKRY